MTRVWPTSAVAPWKNYNEKCGGTDGSHNTYVGIADIQAETKLFE
jgi:hypothetical protein